MEAGEFGRYRLVELIGQGGMGEVYKARDTVMGRDVAIKILPADRGREAGFRERFSREALTCARLTEPHIIPIHDTGEIDGRLYLVMPIINGVDVDTALKRDGPMAPARAVRIIEQIAAALDSAHAHGLVHRDVKPSNALLTDHDFVYLIDFGVAYDSSASKLTTAGRTVGTWAYMAPERLMTDVADARTDVYALACVLYECLTGERPFEGDLVAQQMTAHLTTPPPLPTERRSTIPVGFDDVVARGMAKQPGERYSSAGELAAAAAAALATPVRGQAGEPADPGRTGPLTPAEALRTGGAAPPGSATSSGIGAASFPWPPASEPDRPPYRGWEPFQPIDAGVFFGRDAELVRAMDALHAMRESDETLFVVLGASGAGKSCFLRAGIVPRLQREARSYLVLDIVRPELRALTGACGLAQAICATRRRSGLNDPPLGDIKDACSRGDAAQLRTWLVECRDVLDTAGDGAPPTIVLPLDQAEELFTTDAEAAGFLALIRDLALGADRLPFIVVATVRTDCYGLMQAAPQLAGLQTRQFDLRPMDATQFHSVITGPAQRSTDGGRPLYLDEDLVRQLLADATAGADTLPLLSLTLAWLYRDYGSTGRLTLKPYAERGGIDGVVQAEIRELLSSEPGERAEQLHRLRAAFIPWLATINPDNDQPMRRLARWDDLPADSHPLLERLIARRLLMKDLRDGVVVVEVALESLLRQWEELAGWLAEEGEDLKAADALERGAAEWHKKQREDAWLLHGPRLTAAEGLAAKPGFRDRLDKVRDYLSASRQRENDQAELETQRQQAELDAARKLAAAETQAREQAQDSAAALRQRGRILRAVLAGTSVIAVIAVVGAVVAVVMFRQATREARNALAAELDSQAAAVFSGTITDSNIRALTATLAAQRLRSDPAAGRGALYTAASVLNNTRIIITTPAPVGTVAMNPVGHTLASGGGDGTVRLWDVGDPAHPRALGRPLQGQGAAVASVAFSPDGRVLASGGGDGTVRLWDVADPGRAGPLGGPLQVQGGGVASVAFSPDGRVLACGGGDGTVRLWDVADPGRAGALGGPLQVQGGGVASVAFSPGGRVLASGGGDGRVRMWDVADPAHPTPLGEPLSGNTRFVQDLAFSPDGRTLASGSGDGDIQLWDLADPVHPRQLGERLLGHTGIVQSLAFSPDGRVLASGSDDDTVRLWDVTDPAHAGPLGGPLAGHSGNVPSIAFSPDGRTLASGSQDGNIQLWNLDTALPLQTHAGAVHSVVFSPDGHTLASGNDDATIRLWDLADPVHARALGQPLRGHIGAVESVAFSPDGHALASGGDDGAVRLWNAADVAHPVASGGPLTGHSAPVRSVAFSRDGRTLASGGDDGTVRLWDLADVAHPVSLGGPLTAHSAPVRSVAFSPDGRTLASGGDDATIRLWNVADRNHAAPLSQPFRPYMSTVYSVAFSPDGRTLAAGSGDDTVLLWSVTDLAHPKSLGRPLHGHTGYVYQVAFSPDGHTLASAAADHDVQLWDLEDLTHAHPLGQPLMSHTDTVLSVAFSPDGRSLASGSADTTVRLSPTPLDATVGLLCSKLTSNVSHEDWQQWISPKVGYLTLCPDLPVPQ
ncbi:serine/threonine-protein kinase [Mycobacterium sp. TY814]|uniref:serine/threonine-protein kinase n=1 Tax=unclassified Mycobacterium TaxID=2642494 RepID=UPI0027415722|nr:serine/threonine-protein kinase [Mycobacterium sp. TY814]MDP7722166.1 protein kinase [Mycobacterium sp. TY814]